MVLAVSFSAAPEAARPVLTDTVDSPPWRTLSSRERQVLHWLSLGKSAEEAGLIIGLSISTVMFHCRSAAQKYGTVNRTHTVAEAFRRGDLPIDRPRPTGGGEMYEI